MGEKLINGVLVRSGGKSEARAKEADRAYGSLRPEAFAISLIGWPKRRRGL